MEILAISKDEPLKKKVSNPARILVLGFLFLIIIGAILLSLPYATVDGKGATFLDALFTATSAVCVTGLVVVDTGTYYSVFGQVVILFLIELGGLGFMTFATLFAIILGKRITLKERILLQEALNQLTLEGIVRLVKLVLQIAFVIQIIGALVLTLHWLKEFTFGKAAYFGIFHAVSAFNNAGFDLFGGFDSLTAYTGDIVVNLVILVLVILGGLGFVVISEVQIKRGRKLSLHSQIALISTVVLILLGLVIVFILEYNNPHTLSSMSLFDKGIASLFQAVTPRTAGFNTLPINSLTETTILFMMIYMFIGANPGSTGGGIKTTTFVSLLTAIFANLRGKKEYTLLERTLPRETVEKAITITFSGLLLIIIITGMLTLTEEAGMINLLFETVSAFGTVGLSLGVTPSLSSLGKLAIMFTMYTGRIGTLTLAFALAQRNVSTTHIKYPEEKILIG
ncbi:MAG: Trk family potassium uptake protein [Firmicutes bacterium HGW-Firmicutes-12]|jgi:trk system potassium uptake protein TrkH|nr:MAG: Trk family potassium uptake protein [Firmicutes bacterium HGW-Firmicutes-12]